MFYSSLFFNDESEKNGFCAYHQDSDAEDGITERPRMQIRRVR